MPETQVYSSFRDLLEGHFGLNISARELTSLTRGLTLSGYAYSAAEVYVGQTRVRPKDEDVDQFLRVLCEFHDIFPMHRGQKVYGVFAARDTPETLQGRVWEEGLYLALIDFDYQYQIEIPEGFHPRAF